MNKPKILVTGATGKTGAAVVAQLRKQDWPVRAVVRKHDHRSAHLQQLGAEIAVADLYDPQQLLDAMRGTARAISAPSCCRWALLWSCFRTTARTGQSCFRN